MKILELNNFKYSRESFPEYKFRAKFKIKTVGDEHFIDIYTTDSDKERVNDVLLDRKSDEVCSLYIIHWCTKEQDDLSVEFINSLDF